jgi:hypothetical protein
MEAQNCSFCPNEGHLGFKCQRCQMWFICCEAHKSRKIQQWCGCGETPTAFEKKSKPFEGETKIEPTIKIETRTHHARRHSFNILNFQAYPQMFLDMDRDGQIDKAPAEKIWEWGAGGKGAIIPCHVGNYSLDRVLAPIVFTASIDCEGILIIANDRDRERVRIYAGSTAKETQVLGKSILPQLYEFKIIGGQKLVWGIEATRYDETAKDQEIELIFIPVVNGTPLKDKTQYALVRVTPWIMLHHFNNPLKVYYTINPKLGNNSKFVRSLSAGQIECQAINAKEIFIQDGFIIGCSYFPCEQNSFYHYPVVYRPPISSWASDPALKSLKMPEFCLGKMVENKNDVLRNLMSCGNLEVTPPIENYPLGRIYYSNRMRLEVGFALSEFDPAVAQFLNAQKVQKPFLLDASWLKVGHVDEIVSFLPIKYKNKLVALVPSPRKGFELLCKVAAHMPEADLMIRQAKTESSVRREISAPQRIWKILTVGLESRELIEAATLLHLNLFGGILNFNPELNDLKGLKVDREFLDNLKNVAPKELLSQVQWITNPVAPKDLCYQKYLDDNAKTLRKELNDEVLIIEIPVIYLRSYEPGSRAEALTENMVNMLVLNNNCLFPKPGGPIATKSLDFGSISLGQLCGESIDLIVGQGQDVFEQYMLQVLKKFGLFGHSIDDFLLYQSQGGNVHCGTNTRRQPDPTAKKWWEFEESKK